MYMAEKTGKQTLSIPQLRYLARVERDKLRQLGRRRRMTERMLLENLAVQEAVKELKENGSKDSILPLGAGIFVNGTIAAKSYKRTLPGNVILNATHTEVEKDLNERKKLLEEDMTLLNNEIQSTSTNLNGMNTLLETVRRKVMESKRKK